MTRPKSAESPSIAVHRALAMLDLIAKSAGGLTNSDLSRKLKIPKSSTSYILRALESGGYLRREPEGKYRLGLALLSLASRAMDGLDVRDLALPVLQHLVDRSGLTAHLAVLDHGQAVYIAKVDAPGFIKMNTWPGRRMNLHSTSVGKALLAYLPEDEVARILEKGMKKWTPHTITVAAKLHADLEHTRRRGYATDEQESTVGIRCVAAPIFSAQGVTASIGVTGTVTQFHASEVHRFAEMVKDAARRVSIQLGWSPERTTAGISAR
ncbi:MAG TPA: IclR family transcriptional regulator [Terriglobales bacterium]|nr:IclR family transcriptional regulator [Terriglobales bacterium]